MNWLGKVLAKGMRSVSALMSTFFLTGDAMSMQKQSEALFAVDW